MISMFPTLLNLEILVGGLKLFFLFHCLSKLCFHTPGDYGFVLPPDQILPNSLEIFDGVKAIVRECRVIGYLD